MNFTAHNIRLDDGSYTKPDMGYSMDAHPFFLSTRRLLDIVFPENRQSIRIADLGCLEGGHSVELARLGFQVVGIEVRESNIAACNYVKSNTDLPNLSFVQDDVLNIEQHGSFDAIFCCGLLYHLDKPRAFIHAMSRVTKKLLIAQTHFAPESDNDSSYHFKLSELTKHEDLEGRWYLEFGDDDSFKKREAANWSSWDNRKSFWPRREYLLQAISAAGFDLVMEQFDTMEPNIAGDMTSGFYKTHSRGTFIGIKN